MRTKTLLLSALLGALGSVAVNAQNVYSLNAVGYINVTLSPGFNIITCPLTAADNSVGGLINNGTGAYNGSVVYFYANSTGQYSEDIANKARSTFTNGWENGGTNQLTPGTACWFQNNGSSNLTVTFVGTVPSGGSNPLAPGFNLVGSMVPVSGDIVSNTISSFTNYNLGDVVYAYDPVGQVYDEFLSSPTRGTQGYHNNWEAPGDPSIGNVYQGFWYQNNSASTTVNWVENYSVSE